MRKAAWGLLLLYVFAIPWEYSLDLGRPLGNIARILGLLLLLVAVPAVLQSGRLRNPGPIQWMVLAFYLWFCCTCFWTIDQPATLDKIRAYFQEMMIVWLVWEFAESPTQLRMLMRAFVAGSWVLACLTLANFLSPQAIAEGQVRFVAYGQDPNDVARFLDLGFPLAALLFNSEPRWPARLLAVGFLPLGLVAVLLTASRGGSIAAAVALAGCAVLLFRGYAQRVLTAIFVLPVIAAALWFIVPHTIFERLATIPQQLAAGDLNQRINIWTAGWHAFFRAPILGTGAGSFVTAAGLSPIDTAHNTVLAIAVGGGLCALFLAAVILALAVRALFQMHGPLQIALATSSAVWAVTAVAATVEENRTTWLLLALIALAARLAIDLPTSIAACFPQAMPVPAPQPSAITERIA